MMNIKHEKLKTTNLIQAGALIFNSIDLGGATNLIRDEGKCRKYVENLKQIAQSFIFKLKYICIYILDQAS